jgi:tetratricopeptide (TPR) repeat protein
MAASRRVFLSHTSELRQFPSGRSFVAAAEAAATKSGHVIVDMEYFPARDEPPAAYCEAQVRSCDLYVGLFGLRYGSPVRESPDLSYTELEFDTATRYGVPRLLFLLDEHAVLPIPRPQLFDADPELRDRQRAFRERALATGVMARFITSPEQLEVELIHALYANDSKAKRSGLPVLRLPSAPVVVGREREVRDLTAVWLQNPSAPVAVLGAPGIGKSTVCLAALHDEDVVGRFGERRWFVRCDGAESADALLAVLAAGLGVTGEESSGALLSRVGEVLAERAGLVVLDNFETPWTAEPLACEEILRSVASVPGVALAVTVRGRSRPGGVRWRDFAMLCPLPLAHARGLFLNVAGSEFAADPLLDELVSDLDGLPLAVELAGYAAQGQPSINSVLRRWRAERTRMLERMGGATRELSVAVSVEISVSSARMTGAARRLLTLLGVLPDGIAYEDLTVLQGQDSLGGAAVLRQLGLAFDEAGRLRMLAPIREHVAAVHPSAPADLDTVISHYASLAGTAGGQVGTSAGAGAVTRLQAETGNFTVLLSLAVTDHRIGDLTSAINGLAEYWRFTGYAQSALAALIETEIFDHGTPGQQADTLLALGGIALERSDHDGARARYQQALPLYEQLGDVLGRANCIKGLGHVALSRSDHDGARARYQQALPLYEQLGDVLGQAKCIESLGDVALRRSDHDRARARYRHALPLYEQVGAVLGQANCVMRLADVALERIDHDGALARYVQALALYEQVGSVLGQANCIMRLGDIALAGSNHDGARARYQQALPLYKQVGAVLGQANCIKRLGDIALAGSDHDGARAWYQQALPLYEQVGDVQGQANCIQGLGQIALRKSDHDGASTSYQQALALYELIEEPYSIGSTLILLARLEPAGNDRDRYWQAARQAWASIGRDDLIDEVSAEFEDPHQVGATSGLARDKSSLDTPGWSDQRQVL